MWRCHQHHGACAVCILVSRPDALFFKTAAAAAETTIDAKHEAEETKPEPNMKPNMRRHLQEARVRPLVCVHTDYVRDTRSGITQVDDQRTCTFRFWPPSTKPALHFHLDLQTQKFYSTRRQFHRFLAWPLPFRCAYQPTTWPTCFVSFNV